MKHLWAFLVVICLLPLLLPACSPESEPERNASEQPSNQADEEGLKEMYEEFERAVNSHDVEALVSLYNDDAVRMEVDSPAWIGKQAIRAGWEQAFEQDLGEVHEMLDDFVACGDWAFVRGRWEVVETEKGGGEAIQQSGKWSALTQQQPDGSWKIVWEIPNRDAPLSQLD